MLLLLLQVLTLAPAAAAAAAACYFNCCYCCLQDELPGRIDTYQKLLDETEAVMAGLREREEQLVRTSSSSACTVVRNCESVVTCGLGHHLRWYDTL
jgi:hypothetical protein